MEKCVLDKYQSCGKAGFLLVESCINVDHLNYQFRCAECLAKYVKAEQRICLKCIRDNPQCIDPIADYVLHKVEDTEKFNLDSITRWEPAPGWQNNQNMKMREE